MLHCIWAYAAHCSVRVTEAQMKHNEMLNFPIIKISETWLKHHMKHWWSIEMPEYIFLYWANNLCVAINEALKCWASHYQRCYIYMYFACDNLKLMALIATSIIFKVKTWAWVTLAEEILRSWEKLKSSILEHCILTKYIL